MKRKLDVMETPEPLSSFSLPVLIVGKGLRSQQVPLPTSTDKSRGHQVGKLWLASLLTGTEVRNLQGKRLGKVKDLEVELQTSRVLQVMISKEDRCSARSDHWLVPPQAFSDGPTAAFLQLDVAENPWAAPLADRLDAGGECSKGVGGYQPVAQAFARASFDNDMLDPRVGGPVEVETSSHLFGAAVGIPEEEVLGRVDDLVVDLGSGRVVEVIVALPGLLGFTDEFIAAPPGALRCDPTHGGLRLNATRMALNRAPRFRRGESPNLTEPEYVNRVYRSFPIDAFSMPEGTPVSSPYVSSGRREKT